MTEQTLEQLFSVDSLRQLTEDTIKKHDIMAYKEDTPDDGEEKGIYLDKVPPKVLGKAVMDLLPDFLKELGITDLTFSFEEDKIRNGRSLDMLVADHPNLYDDSIDRFFPKSVYETRLPADSFYKWIFDVAPGQRVAFSETDEEKSFTACLMALTMNTIVRLTEGCHTNRSIDMLKENLELYDTMPAMFLNFIEPELVDLSLVNNADGSDLYVMPYDIDTNTGLVFKAVNPRHDDCQFMLTKKFIEDLLGRLGFTPAKLMEYVLRNFNDKHITGSIEVVDLIDVLLERYPPFLRPIIKQQIVKDNGEEVKKVVRSNRYRSTALLVHEGAMKYMHSKVCKKDDDVLYIIPSSNEELIVFRALDVDNPDLDTPEKVRKMLDRMITEANTNTLENGRIAFDHAFKYDPAKGKLELI